MQDIKKIILRAFFAGEIILFFTFYLFGAHGIQALMRVDHENKVLEQEIVTLKSDLKAAAVEIDEWNNYPFYKEKIARERLHMAYPGDEIYMIIR